MEAGTVDLASATTANDSQDTFKKMPASSREKPEVTASGSGCEELPAVRDIEKERDAEVGSSGFKVGGFEYAQQLKASGDLLAAIDAYKDVLRDEPEHGWAHHCLAQSLWWSGDQREAAEHYRNAVAALPTVTQAIPLCQLAELQTVEGYLCSAWESLVQAVQRDPGCVVSTDYVCAFQSLSAAIAWMFDPDWYAEQPCKTPLLRSSDVTALAAARHYLEHGFFEGLKAHWILDEPFLENQFGVPLPHAPPVLRFLDALGRGKSIAPAWIVDLAWMSKNREKSGRADCSPNQIFRDLCESDFRTSEVTSPLFDPDWYRIVSGISASTVPMKHYILHGSVERIDPHPAFVSEFYAVQASLEKNIDAARHYVVEKGYRKFSPNPVLDLDHYLRKVPSVSSNDEPPLSNFLCSTDRSGAIPRFDRKHYLQVNADIDESVLCPEFHFLCYGFREQHRTPFLGFSPNYIRARHPEPLHHRMSDGGAYWSTRDHLCHSVLVVSHSASRTGAPLIALRLAEELSRISTLDVTTVVFGDGPLVKEFGKHSHVIRTDCQWGADVLENERIIESLVDRLPLVSFCNSSESRHFAKSLHARGLRIISLVHEIADHFDTPQAWGQIFEQSDRVVFPSMFVKERSDIRLGGYLSKKSQASIVLPQGLLSPNFGRFGNGTARQSVREKLSIEAEDVLVLGCGAKDLRKGVDLFLRCASQILSASGGERIHFLWLGGDSATTDNDDPVYWVRKTLEHDAKKRLHFLPSITDVEPYYQAADLFLLSSRSDPYPCVMHEALAAKLPIVYMQDSGGSRELVGARFGRSVPYENVQEMCRAVRELADDGALRAELGNAGAKHVRENCRYVDYVNALLTIATAIDTDLPDDQVPVERSSTALAGLFVPDCSKPEVYFLNPDWGISGINSLTECLIRKLDERGLRSCLLFTRGRKTELPDDASLMPSVRVEYLDVDCTENFPENVHNSLNMYFSRHEPCVLVPNYDYVASSQAVDLPDHIGVVGVVHSDDCEHYEHVNRVGHYWNAIIGVSCHVTRQIAKMNPAYAFRTTCIPNGVEPALSISELDSSLDRDERPIRIVYTGRLVHEQKRVERYAGLILALDRMGIDFLFDFVGAGAAESHLRAALSDQIESGRVIFHGRCTPGKTVDIVLNADVFALFSDYEGMPMSLLEALGAGCIPLVYAMDSGLNDFIDQGVNGYVCHSRTIDEAAGFIFELGDPEVRNRMKKAARTLLETNNLTADAMADSYAKILKSTLAESENELFDKPRWIHRRQLPLKISKTIN